MLVSINLRNFILIDSSVATFAKGLNIVTGETGAGKTLFMQAIGLLLGQKVSSNLIRSGKESAVIEALFDIKNIPSLHSLLNEKGIEFEVSDYLIIKRIISLNNKNRIFINGQMVPLALLEEIGKSLVELVSQNSALLLRKPHVQREMLDIFAGVTQEVEKLKTSYQSKKDLENKLKTQELELREKEFHLHRVNEELKEWTHFNFTSGEGQRLFDHYSQGQQNEEVRKKLYMVQQSVLEETSPFMPALLQSHKELSSLPSSETDYAEIIERMHAAILNLQEASFLLSKKLSVLEEEPKDFQEIDERLTLLNHLKKKYCIEEEEIPERMRRLKKELQRYEELKKEIIQNQNCYLEKKKTNIALAHTITLERKKAANLLEKRVKKELKGLNFNDLEVSICLKSKELGPDGSDTISFCFSPNKGEPLTAIGEKSSGGEISRFLLALKLSLAEKEKIPTLVFDEIDANVGGKTATYIGEKLKYLGTAHQILCITHFSQVASFADHHLCISKNRVDQRIETQITVLNNCQRKGKRAVTDD